MKLNHFILFSLIAQLGFSQVGIGTILPDESALLDVSSSSKGLLFPRVILKSINDKVTIERPAKGLTIYNKNSDFIEEGLYTNIGTPQIPNWAMISPTQLSPEKLKFPGYFYPSSDVLLYDHSTPLFTRKQVGFESFFGVVSDKITLPRDGIYALLVRPSYAIRTRALISGESLPGHSASFIAQYSIEKVNTTVPYSDHFNQTVIIPARDLPGGKTFRLYGTASTMFISGKAGDEFKLSLQLSEITMYLPQEVASVSLVGTRNSGYTNFTITELEDPSIYIK